MNMDFRNVVVTGGSRGIGFAIAQAFINEGSRVLLVARNESELRVAQGKLGEHALIAICDVADAEAVARLSDRIEQEFDDRVDVLVNAAGIYGPMGLLEDNNSGDWKKTFEVNVFGTMLMCRLVLPYMKKVGFGRIINFSGGGEGAFPRFTAYSSSKGAILRFTESLAGEVKGDGITVNAIAPGAVNTALMEEVLAAGAEKVGEDFYQKSIEQKESGGIPAQKAAELVLFLTGDEAAFLTGKLFSAVHDNHDVLRSHAEDIAHSDVYNVRRIKPKDRGFDW